MRSLCRPLVLPLLLCTLPAQYTGEGPPLLVARPPNHVDLDATRFGATVVESIGLIETAPDTYYGGAATRQTTNAPRRIKNFTYDRRQGTVQLLSDFDTIGADDDDSFTVSSDRLYCCFWRSGNVWQAQRSFASGPWQSAARVTGAGLPVNPYCPVLAKRQGREMLCCAGPAPNSRIYLAWIDRGTGQTTVFETITPPVSNAGGDYVLGIGLQVDPITGDASAAFFGVRQGFPNNGFRIHWAPALAANAPVYQYYDAINTIFVSLSPLRSSGTMIAPGLASGLNPSPGNGVFRFDTVMTNDVTIPAAGGATHLNIAVPVTNPTANRWAAALMVGWFAIHGINIVPGSPLALDPGSIVVLPFVFIDQSLGASSYLLQAPTLRAGQSFGIQVVALPPGSVSPLIGSSSRVVVR